MTKMRLSLALIIVLAGLSVIVSSSPDCDCEHSLKHHSKQREVRGFKPRRLATAIDFGKREVSRQNRPPRNYNRSSAICWFVHEMRKNPTFARKMLRKFFPELERKLER